MNYHIVIGANYGDEGKGLMTDYLCRKYGIGRVVRFNGGAQAGHTVQVGERRHVFSNWGSGTFAGAVTELGKEVILNPYHALCEWDTIEGQVPYISIPKNPIITTPIDTKINQLIERQRGQHRHGSCGLGINETVTRTQAMIDRGMSHDITNPEALKWLSDEWTLERTKRLGINVQAVEELMDTRHELIQIFKGVWDQAINSVYKPYETPVKEDIVYEGAQGLGLDEHLGMFPYVTRSNTGIGNALVDIERRVDLVGDTDPQVFIYYMTRTYTTRHGAGPLLGETTAFDVTGKVFGEGRFKDETNVPNPWQQSIRFAPIDLYTIDERILTDRTRNQELLSRFKTQASVCITCMDQTDSVKAITRAFRTPEQVKTEDLPGLFKGYRIPVSHLSYGPTAADVKATNA